MPLQNSFPSDYFEPGAEFPLYLFGLDNFYVLRVPQELLQAALQEIFSQVACQTTVLETDIIDL